MSAFSSSVRSVPSAARMTETGGVTGVEYVSTKYSPDGDKITTWFARSGVRSSRSSPFILTRYR